MRTLSTALFVATLALSMSATSAAAQFVYLGGGGSFPISDYGEYANTGFVLTGGVGIPVGPAGLNVVLEGLYGQNSHSDTDGDKTTPYGFTGGLEYDFGDPDEGNLYVFGGAGILWHKYTSDTFGDASESGLALQAGAGYGLPLGGLTGWVEGRIVHASIEDSNTSFIGALAGISVPFGG